jgi:simple sugar transport system permease protein
LGGACSWLADIGLIDTFSRGNRAGEPVVDGIPMLIVWASCWCLRPCRADRPASATGFSPRAATRRRHAMSGVPVNRVKILMFMFTAFCATSSPPAR